MSCYHRGDVVYVVSPYDHKKSKAIFVKHDKKGFPMRDVILATGIGVKGNRMTHKFRWPLKYTRPA